jgi:YgiT-type zinc finger domain-containing protein
MKCQTPGCTGEHRAQTISHEVVYQKRTVVIHNVPADICPDCGGVVIAHETLYHVGSLLGRKKRSKAASHVYEV